MGWSSLARTGRRGYPRVMAHQQDLEPCTYGFPRAGRSLLAVGWLARGHVFTRGRCEPSFAARLRELLKDAWAPVDFCGPHFCDLCPTASTHSGVANLFVPSETAVFVAPELVVHYIEEHAYQPPAEFVAAVMACPPMNSEAFHSAIARHYRPFE